ncbi:MAG: hypothetical protein PVI57_11085 [Gemmatimonadota bacterium]|jgi:hypothetical protein
MASRTLVSGALLALALQLTIWSAPAAGQQYDWTYERPDGVAPASLFATRVLPAGVVQIAPQFRSFDHTGTRFGSEFISYEELLGLFEEVPFAMSSDLFAADVSFGVTPEFTLLARVGWLDNTREVVDQDLQILTLENDGITDVEVHGLYQVYAEGPWRAHLSGGLSLPTGSVDDEDGVFRSGPLPYDMQTGAGVVGLLPGATVQTMNEHGSVGMQVTGRIYVGENDRGWRPGNGVQAAAWASYRFNRFFSVSSGVYARAWNPIEGFDPDLHPERDPGELPSSFGGERVDIPLGVNLRLPEGPLAGHRLGVDFLFNVHEDLDGPWLAADDGFTITWTKAF